MDFFKELGIKREFEIDLSKFEEMYVSEVLKFHPDKFINASDEEKKKAEEKTVHLNKAYNNLKNPLSRALHLLELEGVFIKDVVLDFPAMMKEVFEERELLSDANSEKEILFLLNKANSDLDMQKKSFSALYNANHITKASVLYKKMLYKAKFIEEIKEKLSEF